MVFRMMAGLVPPKTAGLSDESQILLLVRRSKFIFNVWHKNNEVLAPIICITFILFSYAIKYSTVFDLVVFGIPNSLYYSVLGVTFFEINSFQLSYFYIICVYLKFKLQSINAKLLEKKSKTSIAYIVSQLKAMNSLYKEINEYNSQFWSQYFLVFWFNMGSSISIYIYIVLFSGLNIIQKVTVFYSLICFCILSLFMVFTASSVNYEAKKSYKILNHLFVSMFVEKSFQQNKWHSINRRLYSFRHMTWIIKVFLIIFFSLNKFIWSIN